MSILELLQDEMFEVELNDDGLLNEMAGLLMNTAGCGNGANCGNCCNGGS